MFQLRNMKHYPRIIHVTPCCQEHILSLRLRLQSYKSGFETHLWKNFLQELLVSFCSKY